MSVVQRTLVLTGAHAGKTIQLGDFRFVDGKYSIMLPVEEAEGIQKYLGRCYQAYQEGSIELAKAQQRDGAENGEHVIQPSSQSGSSTKAPGDPKSSGQGSSQGGPADGSGSDESGQG